jgi:hypothetical protein
MSNRKKIRIRIGIEKDGIISSVYVNFDGDERCLKYYTEAEIEKIMSFGDLAQLNGTLLTSYTVSYSRKAALELPGAEIFYLYSVEKKCLLINTSIGTFLPL